MPNKLSSRLRNLLASQPGRLQTLADQGVYAVDYAGDQTAFAVIVKHRGDYEELKKAGLVFRSEPSGYITTGTATRDVIHRLEALDTVLAISTPHRIRRDLNVAVPAISANLAQESGVGGDGVLVGIIDTGLNWRHPDFCNPDGTTRILAIWDQTLTPQGSEAPPANFTFGVEYSSAQINAALLTSAPLVPIRTTDPEGHGTHVTGIAAGNGRASEQMLPRGNYSGVAPQSRIVFVRVGRALGAFEDDVIDAVNYLAEKSAGLARPIAINISLGKKLGPHDGQSHFEQAIDAILARGVPGLVIVKSAGNEGAAAHHVSTTVDKRVVKLIPVDLAENDSHTEIEFWYPRMERVLVTVTDQNATERLTVAPGEDKTKDFASGDRLHISSTVGEPESNDNLITITVSRYISQPLATWSISLEAITLLPVQIDGYLESNDYATQFRGTSVTPFGTITEPGNARRIITVGAYITKTTGYGIGLGDLASFSSRGPTRDRLQKPDVAAPGDYTDSANSAYPPAPNAGAVPPYVGMSGTSMAAPAITGTAALILTVSRETLQTTARSFLRETARSDEQTGETPNYSWGYGKVDAFAAVASAREHLPQGAPVVHAPPPAPAPTPTPPTPVPPPGLPGQLVTGSLPQPV